MVFKAEVTQVAKSSYGKTFMVTADGKWEGYESEPNVNVVLSVPQEKAREFRLGDGIEVRILRPVEAL